MFSATSLWSSGEFSPCPGARPSLAIVFETEAAVAALLDEVRRVVNSIRGLLEIEPELDSLLTAILAGALQSF